MLKKSAIGFFDSGVGQLSVLVEAKKLLPYGNFATFADQKHLPFGTKTQRQLLNYASNAIQTLQSSHQIILMVIACNTASVTTLESLRKKFNIPIVGVVPAIKSASQITKNGKIAVFATTSTTKSEYLKNLIEKYAKDKKVLKIPCPHLATAIENADEDKTEKLIAKYAKLSKNFSADTVVLGCTHYSLALDLFKKYLGKDVQILDSTKGVAKRIKELLAEKSGNKKGSDFFYTTGNVQMFSKVASGVLKYKVDAKHA